MPIPIMIRTEANVEFDAASRDSFFRELTAILTRRERRLLPGGREKVYVLEVS